MTCFTLDRSADVKKFGMGPLGSTPWTPGSSGPGTNMNLPPLATFGNLHMTDARSSKYPIIAFVDPPPESGLEVKFPMKTKIGSGSNELYPPIILSILSMTAGLSRYTSESTTNIPSWPCSISCSRSFSNSESEPMESNMSVFCKPIALMASERFSTMGLPDMLLHYVCSVEKFAHRQPKQFTCIGRATSVARRRRGRV